MSDRPSSIRGWLRRYSLSVTAGLGSAVGLVLAVGYAAKRHGEESRPPPAAVVTAPVTAVAEMPRDTVQDALQIAILLDTSSSMDGLINQARSHLWQMVDEMGRMTRVVGGKRRGVRVELALYEYGHSLIPAADGFIREIVPFTTDLDRVSEELHRLTTNGGDEYAGQAIQRAVESLRWSSDPSALKFVFVAGNEGFDQGPITAQTAMAAAQAKDIQVQLIFCGGEDSSWSAAAALARTDLMKIDQDRVAAYIPAPQDAEILRLGGELNGTYVAYGVGGAASKARQASADQSSAKLSPKVALERAQLKRKGSYRNEHWDLVDAQVKDADVLRKTPEDDLPAELRGKSLEEKKGFVAAKAAERSALKAKIAKLEAERRAFLAQEQANRAPEAPSLESEMMKSAKKKAAGKGYSF